MKANSAPRQITSQGTEAVSSFRLSIENSVHIMTILRDTLYSDRILAVLREYASNAWDAHRSVGKHETPIKVSMPRETDPVLKIRDYGPGLDDHDVMAVYTQYGESSKRDTDDQVGALGIGCKSAFAYTDQFTVTSWHNGTKSVYVAVLDKSNVGEMRRLHQEPCDEETGIEIQVPVLTKDISGFHERAKYLFSAFYPAPDINIDLPAPPELLNGRGHLELDGSRWTAVMGCVPYRLDMDQLPQDEVYSRLRNIGGSIHLDIGDVEISASREELKYTSKTVNALVARLEELQDLYLENFVASLKHKDSWQQRRLVASVRGALNLPVPKGLEHLKLPNSRITIYTSDLTKPETFRWVDKELLVSSQTTLVLHTEDKSVKGYSMNYRDALIAPLPNKTPEDVQEELKTYLPDNYLDGIPQDTTENRSWYSHRVPASSRPKDPRHLAKLFRLDDVYSEPLSRRWEIVNRTPQDDDVFVILHKFEVNHSQAFYHQVREDRRLADALGISDKLPAIYGYKLAAEKKAKGVPYSEWRKRFFVENLPADKRKLLENRILVELFRMDDCHKVTAPLKTWLSAVQKRLGSKHTIVKVLKDIHDVIDRSKEVNHLSGLTERFNIKNGGAKRRHKLLTSRYPLLNRYGFFAVLQPRYQRDISSDLALWLDYIQLVDRDRSAQ